MFDPYGYHSSVLFIKISFLSAVTVAELPKTQVTKMAVRKLVKALEHKLCGKQLRELGMKRLEKTRFRGDLIALHK